MPDNARLYSGDMLYVVFGICSVFSCFYVLAHITGGHGVCRVYKFLHM